MALPRLGLGCMGMSGTYGRADEDEAMATIDRAIDLGITLLDTADVYSAGENERLVGRAIRGRRDEVLVATKVGNLLEADGTFGGVDGRPEHVMSACTASLARLDVETIDLYYLHRADPNVPIEDTIGAMKTLVDQGKLRHIGLSEAGPATLRRAHAVHPIAVLQSEYSLWSRDVEGSVLGTCRDLGIAFVAYSPLGRGFLGGDVGRVDDLETDDNRRRFPRFQPGNITRNLPIVEGLREVAAAKGCTPAVLALAWVLSSGGDVTAIPGTRHRRHLEENALALQIELDDTDLRRLDEIAPPGIAAGARYHAAGMRKLDG
ncbi:MAG: aldo/keto reductase [Acidimicrobiales bacterium]